MPPRTGQDDHKGLDRAARVKAFRVPNSRRGSPGFQSAIAYGDFGKIDGSVATAYSLLHDWYVRWRWEVSQCDASGEAPQRPSRYFGPLKGAMTALALIIFGFLFTAIVLGSFWR